MKILIVLSFFSAALSAKTTNTNDFLRVDTSVSDIKPVKVVPQEKKKTTATKKEAHKFEMNQRERDTERALNNNPNL